MVLPFVAIIRNNHPFKRIHEGRNDLRLRYGGCRMAIHELIQEEHKNEDSRNAGGMNIQSSQMKPNHSLLAFGQSVMNVFQPGKGPKKMSS